MYVCLCVIPQQMNVIAEFLKSLSLKTCPSRDGRLQLIDLVDTPGLADGELQYPFNIEKVILEMASCVDLFLGEKDVVFQLTYTLCVSSFCSSCHYSIF